ncbi:adenosylmethionine decarboxylase [Halocynthiibacter sp.]|uniref:adenosylmethionine decarboxylase n=1 Tax=Halocynthiibacter sp. TaxID=1979210 RepID=UPI003C3E1C6F
MNTLSSEFRPPQRLGQHVIADFYDAENLLDMSDISDVLRRAANAANATVLEMRLHDFGAGYGFTGFALLAESHISVHTWPEHHYVAIDIFMCGNADAEKSLAVLKQHFRPREEQIQRLDRGDRLAATSLEITP